MSDQDETPADKAAALPAPESSETEQAPREPEGAVLSSASVDEGGGEPEDPAAETKGSVDTGMAVEAVSQGTVPGETEGLASSEAGVVSDGAAQEGSESAREEPGSLDAADAAVLAASRRQTRRSFVVAAAGAAAGYGLYRWIDQSRDDDMQPEPLRRLFQANAAVAREVFRDHALAPTYPVKAARDLRVNGIYGLKRMLVPESWRLQLVGAKYGTGDRRFTNDVTAWEYKYAAADSHEDEGHDTKIDPNMKTAAKMAPESMVGQAKAEEDRTERMPRGTEEAGESDSTLQPRTPGLLLTMDDILKLPRHELVTQFKCIEGWSEIVHWAGVRMADFMEAYPPAAIDGREPKYVYMETPDGDYYTGYDLEVCRHPQTLLVTEMMGAPLTQFHGAPLRLHMPTKYGYKQIKRIGLISYTNEKPDDYWTKLGYDWYAGL